MTGGLGSAALVAFIAITPVVVLMLTSFVKISVVLSLLRNALGAPEAPSGLVVMGVSLILTFFVMAPVAIDIVHAAASDTRSTPSPTTPSPTTPSPTTPSPTTPSPTTPSPTTPSPSETLPRSAQGEGARAATSPAPAPLDFDGAIRKLVPAQYRPEVDRATRALKPLREFLARHASARDRETFTALATRLGHVVQGDEIWVLAPAFVTTELREAFAIAVLIFVPFLVIDLVVGLGLAALGLSTTSPQTIALPFKLLLFVSVDGWRLLIDGLLRGYV